MVDCKTVVNKPPYMGRLYYEVDSSKKSGLKSGFIAKQKPSRTIDSTGFSRGGDEGS